MDTESNKSPVNLELNVHVSVHSSHSGGSKRSGNSGTRTNQNGKGKRQSPQSPAAITNYFPCQTKPHSPNQCVQLNHNDKSLDNGTVAGDDAVNGCSPQHRQLNKQARDNGIPDASTASAIFESVTPKKSNAQDRNGTKVNENKIQNGVRKSDAAPLDDASLVLSPKASHHDGTTKQNTPHRMVWSPVKAARQYTKPTVASFSQLNIKDSSPISKMTGSKTDKKTRRR